MCAAIEAEIAQLEEADRAEFLAELELEEPGLNRVIRARLSSCWACRPTSPRARRKCVPGRCVPGATAPQAAGVIHTDFERGFIRAEVIAFEDYIAGNAARAARAKPASCGWKARNTSSTRAMSCISGSTSRFGDF